MKMLLESQGWVFFTGDSRGSLFFLYSEQGSCFFYILNIVWCCQPCVHCRCVDVVVSTDNHMCRFTKHHTHYAKNAWHATPAHDETKRGESSPPPSQRSPRSHQRGVSWPCSHSQHKQQKNDPQCEPWIVCKCWRVVYNSSMSNSISFAIRDSLTHSSLVKCSCSFSNCS